MLSESTKNRGFTLVELLVVIVIIGLISAGVTPTLRGNAERQKYESSEAQLDSIEAAMQSMISVKGVTSVADASAALKDISGVDVLQNYLSRPIDEILDSWGNEYQVYVHKAPGQLKLYVYVESSEAPNDTFDGVTNIRCNTYRDDKKMLRVIVKID